MCRTPAKTVNSDGMTLIVVVVDGVLVYIFVSPDSRLRSSSDCRMAPSTYDETDANVCLSCAACSNFCSLDTCATCRYKRNIGCDFPINRFWGSHVRTDLIDDTKNGSAKCLRNCWNIDVDGALVGDDYRGVGNVKGEVYGIHHWLVISNYSAVGVRKHVQRHGYYHSLNVNRTLYCPVNRELVNGTLSLSVR